MAKEIIDESGFAKLIAAEIRPDVEWLRKFEIKLKRTQRKLKAEFFRGDTFKMFSSVDLIDKNIPDWKSIQSEMLIDIRTKLGDRSNYVDNAFDYPAFLIGYWQQCNKDFICYKAERNDLSFIETFCTFRDSMYDSLIAKGDELYGFLGSDDAKLAYRLDIDPYTASYQIQDITLDHNKIKGIWSDLFVERKRFKLNWKA